MSFLGPNSCKLLDLISAAKKNSKWKSVMLPYEMPKILNVTILMFKCSKYYCPQKCLDYS